jgi:hypothetical protein
MKVGPDAGAGANRGVSVAAAPAAVLEEPGNAASVTGNAGRRKPREHEVAGSLDDGVGWPLVRDHVIQPGESAHRVGMVAHWSRSTPRRGRGRVRGRTWCPRRALNLTRKSGTCTCTRKGGGTHHHREQWFPAHCIPPHLWAVASQASPGRFVSCDLRSLSPDRLWGQTFIGVLLRDIAHAWWPSGGPERLLPQPGGFEGLFARLQPFHPDDPASVDCPDAAQLQVAEEEIEAPPGGDPLPRPSGSSRRR